MTAEQIIERERRWAAPAALAAIGAIGLQIAAVLIGADVDLSHSQDRQNLIEFADNSGTLLLSAILSTVALGLFAGPLVFLFKAADARSDKVRSSLVGITVAAPLFMAVHSLVGWAAINEIASSFGDLAQQTEAKADALREDSALRQLSEGLLLGGLLGMAVAVFYSSLQALRTGLLTRFWGSLGMALGATLLLLGLVGAGLWLLAVGLLIAGWWPSPRPPAWDAGIAIPWPAPGEDRESPSDEDEQPPDENQ